MPEESSQATQEAAELLSKAKAKAEQQSPGFTPALRHPLRQIAGIVLLLCGLTVIGTVGLRITTEAPWFDCLYMAVITLTTVGYGESVPLGTAGRVFIIGYLAIGIGVFTFSAFTLGSLLVSAELHGLWRRRRMQMAVDRLSGHFIICGCGRMGTIIGEHLETRQQPFVIVDRDEQRLNAICEPRGWKSVAGDATDDRTLLAAGVDRAQSLAAVLPTDADNVYVVLSARMLATELQIIARASDLKAIGKL
jgi:voltage-gated potassium channel